jgi:hypothetical protein
LVGSRPFRVFDRVDSIHIPRLSSPFLHSIKDIDFVYRTYYSKEPEQLSHLQYLRAIDCGDWPPEIILRLVPRPDRLEELTCIDNKERGFCIPNNEGLSCLRQVPNLQKLEVHAVWESQASYQRDVANLVLLRCLRYLEIRSYRFGSHSDIEIDDECLSYIENLCHLEVLVVWGWGVTDAGVSHLSSLRRLRRLDVPYTSLTDAGLQHLAKLERLEELDITGTKVTDEGLERLQHWKQLKHLRVSGERMTPEGIRRLKEAIPNCMVEEK